MSEQTDFKPTNVKCPYGVDAEVGQEFDCHFTGPDGAYTAHLKVTKVDATTSSSTSRPGSTNSAG